MRSKRQSEASRINGAKSRGPKTPQGRATSSLNATKHGITAKTLTVANESQELLLEMMNSYFDYFAPTNQVEIDIVRDIVAARWRLHRIWRYQTALLDVEMNNQSPEFEKRYATFEQDMPGAAAFSALIDYITAIRTDIHITRIYRRAIEDLLRLRGGNILNENKIFQNEPEPQGLSPLDLTKTDPEISTEPKELEAP